MNGSTAHAHSFWAAFGDFLDAVREKGSDGLAAIKQWGLSEKKHKAQEGNPKGGSEGMKASFEVKHTPGYEEGTSGESSLSLKFRGTKEEVLRMERAIRMAMAGIDPEPPAKGKKEVPRDA